MCFRSVGPIYLLVSGSILPHLADGAADTNEWNRVRSAGVRKGKEGAFARLEAFRLFLPPAVEVAFPSVLLRGSLSSVVVLSVGP